MPNTVTKQQERKPLLFISKLEQKTLKAPDILAVPFYVYGYFLELQFNGKAGGRERNRNKGTANLIFEESKQTKDRLLLKKYSGISNCAAFPLLSCFPLL